MDYTESFLFCNPEATQRTIHFNAEAFSNIILHMDCVSSSKRELQNLLELLRKYEDTRSSDEDEVGTDMLVDWSGDRRVNENDFMSPLQRYAKITAYNKWHNTLEESGKYLSALKVRVSRRGTDLLLRMAKSQHRQVNVDDYDQNPNYRPNSRLRNCQTLDKAALMHLSSVRRTAYRGIATVASNTSQKVTIFHLPTWLLNEKSVRVHKESFRL